MFYEKQRYCKSIDLILYIGDTVSGGLTAGGFVPMGNYEPSDRHVAYLLPPLPQDRLYPARGGLRFLFQDLQNHRDQFWIGILKGLPASSPRPYRILTDIRIPLGEPDELRSAFGNGR